MKRRRKGGAHRSARARPTLATALLQGLKDHGAGEIFGIPGDFVLPFFKVIEESGILPHYTLSHEPAVGFAADAAARYRCGLGVAVVAYGAGAFNLVNPIAGAYAERSPVALVRRPPRQASCLLGCDPRYFVFEDSGRPEDLGHLVVLQIR